MKARFTTTVLALGVAIATVAGLELYRSHGVVRVEPEPIRPVKRGVQVTTSAISFDGAKLVDLLPVGEQATMGVEARYKAHGINDLAIVPLVSAVARRPLLADEQAHGLSIELSPETPYRTMVEVLFSVGQGPVTKLHLLVRPGGSQRALELESDLPQTWPQAASGLGATVFLVSDGISIKFPGGNVAPGCKDRGPGLAIPKHDGYDWASFAVCFRRLNTVAQPPVAGALLIANPGVPALELLRASNVVRCGEPDCGGKQIGSPFVQRVGFGIPR